METPQTIGIVGGGQLARMLTQAALPLGFKVVVINPAPGSPAAQAGAEEIIGDIHDSKAMQQLADRVDVITIELEDVNTDTLDELVHSGKIVSPAPKTVRMIQDKFAQKEFLSSAGIPVAAYLDVPDQAAAEQAFDQFEGKLLLKTKRGAFDGRGNRLVTSQHEITEALHDFKGQDLYAEAYVPFQMELAVMIARSSSGEIVTYPVVQTIQERNICVEVIAPAPVSQAIQDQADALARSVASLLEGAGVFGIEMFLTADNTLIVNEIAPRVHNSGHYTIEANQTSQFEQHIRAVSGLPLGTTDLVVPAAVMVNILGERDGPTEVRGIDKITKSKHTKVHIYGKSPTKVDRKMGHITATGSTIEVARTRARAARKDITI